MKIWLKRIKNAISSYNPLLKDKHGSGYQLEVKLKADKLTTAEDEEKAVKDFEEFTKSLFPHAKTELKENFGKCIG